MTRAAVGHGAAVAVALIMGAFAQRVGAATYHQTVPRPARFAFVTNLTNSTISNYTVDSTGFLRPNGYTLCSSGGAPLCIAVDPLSRFAHCGTFGTGAQNALISYTLGANGRLAQTASISPFAGPNDLSYSVDGNTLYYPNLDSNFLRQFTVNATTGALTQLGGDIPSGMTPETPVVHPTLRVAYCVNYTDSNISVYSMASGTNALTETTTPATRVAVSPAGVPGPIAMTVSRNGRWAYVANYEASTMHVYTIDQTTGALTSLAGQQPVTVANMVNPTSLVVDNTSNTLYVCNDGSNNVSVLSLNQTTGAITLIQTIAAGTNPARINLDPSNNFVYVVNRVSNDVTMYSRSASTGQLTTLGTVRTQGMPYAMAVSAGATALTPTPRFAYCTNSGVDNIGMYSINATSGALTALNPATIGSNGDQPLWAEIEPTGRFLYCLNRGDNGGARGIQRFSINATSGQLTAQGGLVATDDGPRRFAIEPSGRFLYLAHDTDRSLWTFSIDPGTGALIRLTAAGHTILPGNAVWGLSVDVTGQYLLLPDRTNNVTSVYAINPTTGTLTFVADSAAQGTGPYTVRGDPTGRFVYVGNTPNPETAAYTLAATGTMGTIGTASAGGTTSIQLDVTPNGRFAYSANFGTNNVGRFTVNQTTGALTGNGVTGVGTRPQGLIVDPSGRFLYVPNSGSDTISQFSINQTTGALTAIGGGTVATGDGPHTVTIFGVLQ